MYDVSQETYNERRGMLKQDEDGNGQEHAQEVPDAQRVLSAQLKREGHPYR